MDNQTLEVKLTEFITKLNAMGCKFDDNNNLLHQEINEIKTIVNKTEHSNITLITKFKSMEEKLDDNNNLLHQEINEIKTMVNGDGCTTIKLIKIDLENTKGKVKKCETIRDYVAKIIVGAILVAVLSLVIIK